MDDDKYLSLTRDKEFEQAVRDSVTQLFQRLDTHMSYEVKLRYITHVFANTLDHASEELTTTLN